MATKYIRRAQFLGDERGLVFMTCPDTTTINTGDLVWLDTSNGAGMVYVAPFSSLPDVGTKAQNQAQAHTYFLGVAMRSHASGTGSALIPVATSGVFEFDCASSIFDFGTYLGPIGTGTAAAVGVSNTSVETVATADLAIGVVYSQALSNTTRVQCLITSQVFVAVSNGITAVSATTVTATGAIKSSSVSGGVGYATGAGGAITQITTSATGVTLNTICGAITTVALTTAAGAEERFTVTNSACGIHDVVVLGTTYNGAGTPIMGVANITAGTFDVIITNLHASAALNALMVINFAIIKAVNA